MWDGVRGRARKLGAGVVGLAFVAVVVAAASAYAGSLAPDTEDPAVQAAAAQYYAQRYDVSLDVADQRLQIQDDAGLVLGDAIHALGSSFAGSWFDATDGGRLKIGVAASAATPSGAAIDQAKQILATKGVDQYTDFVPEASSLNDLLASQHLLDQKLLVSLPLGSFATSIEPQRDAAVVTVATGLTGDQLTAVRDAVAAASTPAGTVQSESSTSPVSVDVETANTADLSIKGTSCAFLYGGQLYCDPALRGGVLIGSTYNQCTAGFLVSSLSDSKPYLMTAGHCLWEDGGSQWSTHFSDGTLHAIGYRHSYTWGSVTGGSGDYGIITINNPSGWGLTANSYVWVGPSAEGITTQNSFYSITGVGTSSTGLTLCTTSGWQLPNGYHTECGTVVGLNRNRSETINGTTAYLTGLGEINSCNGIEGSSGSPFFKNGLGYGLESGGASTCDNFYQGLAGALGSNLGLL
jgi:hypothetical protein